jgi:hypothetical protein
VNLKHALKQQARQLGFSLVGVTTSDLLPHANVFDTWLGLGRQGEMTYLDTPRSRACRAYPEQLMADCRSVLVLGMRYPSPPVIIKNIHTSQTHVSRLCLGGLSRPPSGLSGRFHRRPGRTRCPEPLVYRHRANPGARAGTACRAGMDWKEHLLDQPGSRLILSTCRGPAGYGD